MGRVHRRGSRRRSARGRAAWVGIAAACMVSLLGCAVAVPVKKTDVEPRVTTSAERLVVGETDRSAVRASLGEPQVVGDRVARFDLFRLTGRAVSAPVMFVFWWPVPLGVCVDETNGYVLVEYDGGDVVSNVAHAFGRDASLCNEAYDSPARLATEGLKFSADADGADPMLSVAHVAGMAYLQSRPPGAACRLLVGCASWNCEARVRIDGAVRTRLTQAQSGFHRALEPVDVLPGEHMLAVDSPETLTKFEAEMPFQCVAGNTLHASLGLAMQEQAIFSRTLKATLVVDDEAPNELAEHDVVVWRDGQWLPSQPASPDRK